MCKVDTWLRNDDMTMSTDATVDLAWSFGAVKAVVIVLCSVLFFCPLPFVLNLALSLGVPMRVL